MPVAIAACEPVECRICSHGIKGGPAGVCVHTHDTTTVNILASLAQDAILNRYLYLAFAVVSGVDSAALSASCLCDGEA
jgi:hypothetical protein